MLYMIFMYLIALFAVAIWHATVYQPIDDISIHQTDKYIHVHAFNLQNSVLYLLHMFVIFGKKYHDYS